MSFKIFLKNYFPLTVRLLLGKALLFFVIYQFVLSLELKAIHHPLTSHVGEYSVKLLNKFVDPPSFSIKREFVYGAEASQVYYNNNKIVFIADSCNGFIAFMRYIGIIFCFPSQFWRKLFYVISGLLIIHLLNIVRCAGLAYINLFHQPHFRLAHDYWFKGVLYGTILILWLLYLRKAQFHNNFWNKKTDIA